MEASREIVVGHPRPSVAPYVRRYLGYRFQGFEPGNHRAGASAGVAFVVSLGAPVRSLNMDHGFHGVVSGPRLSPVLLPNGGDEFGIDIGFTTAGLRGITGFSAAELRGQTVSFADLVGAPGAELIERLQLVDTWRERFDACDHVLSRLAGHTGPDVELLHAWSLIQRGQGTFAISSIAEAVGWTRQHLARRFRAEFGLRPKQASRLVRFGRANAMIRSSVPTTSLAQIAASCGYSDQSHLHRDAVEFAGCTPLQLGDDNLPFVQDGPEPDPQASCA